MRFRLWMTESVPTPWLVRVKVATEAAVDIVQLEPSVQVWPFTVVLEFVRPELFRVPLAPNCTLPPDGFERLSVMPLNGAELRRFSVDGVEIAVPLTSGVNPAKTPALLY